MNALRSPDRKLPEFDLWLPESGACTDKSCACWTRPRRPCKEFMRSTTKRCARCGLHEWTHAAGSSQETTE